MGVHRNVAASHKLRDKDGFMCVAVVVGEGGGHGECGGEWVGYYTFYASIKTGFNVIGPVEGNIYHQETFRCTDASLVDCTCEGLQASTVALAGCGGGGGGRMTDGSSVKLCTRSWQVYRD